MKTPILPLFAILVLSGCVGTPIKTTFDLHKDDDGFPAMHYSSEKDVIYRKTLTLDDGTVEETSFQALASAAAFAQAERDKVQAEANAANGAALLEALKLIPGTK